ncbi:hypothetical protein IZY60_03065 [Lutibacter sp. B2]|nr:hypothetical protein [Lutibacter sp. B2]
MGKKRIIILVLVFLSIITCKNFLWATPVVASYEETKLLIKRTDHQILYSSEDKMFFLDDKDKIYIKLNTLKTDMGVNGSYDDKHKIAVITTKDKVFRFYGKENIVRVNGRIVNDIPFMKIVEGSPYIEVNSIKNDMKLYCNFIEKNNIIFMKNQMDTQHVANVKKDSVKVKGKNSMFSNVVDELNKDEAFYVIEKEEYWAKILTANGVEGYIRKIDIENERDEKGIEEDHTPIWKPATGKIIMTWEHVTSKNPNTSEIKNLQGVNVISPTWLSLTDASGGIKQNISKEYSTWAKAKGYKIWALFSNSFDCTLTDEFLNDALAREKAINTVLKIVVENNLDGINIDFENVYLKNKDMLTTFIRELTPVFHEKGLVVSMDVTVKGGSENWSQCYDRESLGLVVDYMPVMTYDEHWRTSPISGSVASMGWVDQSIERILEEVNPNKVLLGVPFYTRAWMETPSKTKANKMDVTSKALSMESSNEIIKKYNLSKIWDESSGQHYVAYIDNNILYKIWIEDGKSMGLRADIANKYNLAGVAGWRRGFETEDIWTVLDQKLNY